MVTIKKEYLKNLKVIIDKKLLCVIMNIFHQLGAI